MTAFKRVYLIGFMGCGKTTAGKKLAALLGWKFVDLDREIEEFAGMKIPEIFRIKGEEWFRKTESELLRNVRNDSDAIISTGGGSPCYADNMDYMIHSGLTIYIKMTPGQLKSRLSDSKDDRPLLKNLNEDELIGFIKQKLEEREYFYGKAQLITQGIDLDVVSLKDLVLQNLEIRLS
jgi:shikimate kinase